MVRTTCGLDIAKSVMQLHWVDVRTGEIGRKKVARCRGRSIRSRTHLDEWSAPAGLRVCSAEMGQSSRLQCRVRLSSRTFRYGPLLKTRFVSLAGRTACVVTERDASSSDAHVRFKMQ